MVSRVLINLELEVKLRRVASLKVLLVDDESDLLKQAKIFLERERDCLEIETAISAQEGLKLLEEKDYAAVVSDYQMPEMDGLEFLETVREDRESDIPFLVFTGRGREEVAVEALNLGADRYIHKGGDPESQYGVLGKAIVQEIERRKMELRRDFFRISASRAPEAIFVADKNANITYVNKGASEKLGYSVDELEDMKVFDLDPNFSPENWEEHWEETRERGEYRIETQHVRKDGTKLPVELLINRIVREGEEYHFTFARDISKRKERKAKLESFREEFRELINGMNDMVFVHDLEGNFLSVNDAAVERLGYSREEFLEMRPHDIAAFEFAEEIEEKIRRMEGGENLVFESVHITKEGERIPVEISSGLITHRGDPAVLSVARDISERKKAKRELEEKNRQLSTLFDNLPGLVYRCLDNKNWTMKLVSDGCKELMRYRPEELVDDKEIAYNEIIHPGDRDYVRNKVHESLREKEPFNVEYRIVTSSGEEKWVWEQGKGIFDENGEVKFLEGIVIDITERKRIEEELSFRNNLLNSLLENMPDTVYFKDRDAKFIEVSDSKAEELGRDKEEILGKSDFDFFPDNQAREMYEDDMKVIEDEEPVIGKEEKVETPQGSEKWVSATKVPLYGGDGEVMGMLGISRDITEQIEREREIERERNLLNSMLENFPASIYIKNSQGEHIRVNERLRDSLKKRGIDDVIGKTDKELYPESGEDYEEDMRVMENEEPVINREDVGEYPDGQKVYNLISKAPIYDEKGDVNGLVGFNLDITRRIEAEKREEFLHSLLRHDVRNKAQIVQGYLELLEDTDLSEEQKELVTKAMKGSKEGLEIIEKVRTLRELDETKTERLKIGPLLEKVVEENKSRAKEKDIAIKFEYCDFEVRGGPLLEDLFLNLIENSIVHSGCDVVRIDCEEKEKELIVMVEDDGKGIPDEDKDRIFERGFRDSETGGTGLGTYLAKEIARSYGGEIDVCDSELGGAKFEVRLKKA